MSEEQSPLRPPGAGPAPGRASDARAGLAAAKLALARMAADRFARLAWFASTPKAAAAFRAAAQRHRARAEALARIAGEQ